MSAEEVLARCLEESEVSLYVDAGAAPCGYIYPDDIGPLTTKLLDALKAAGYEVVELPKPVSPPDHWRAGIIGAWQGPIGEEPVSAWTTNEFDCDAVAMPGGDFITAADARALGLALLAAANAAEAQA